eukprot:COSAG06_NODE_1630_length_8867_cov_7.747833_8_plen_159_part_00
MDDHYETPTEAATRARPDPRLTAGATDAATSDAVTSDEVANKVMDGAKALGEKVGMLGKAAGLAARCAAPAQCYCARGEKPVTAPAGALCCPPDRPGPLRRGPGRRTSAVSRCVGATGRLQASPTESLTFPTIQYRIRLLPFNCLQSRCDVVLLRHPS